MVNKDILQQSNNQIVNLLVFTYIFFIAKDNILEIGNLSQIMDPVL